MPNSNNQQNSSGSGIKTAATLGIGAVIGALAAGAAWYFSSEEESRQRPHHEIHRASHPVHRPAQPVATPNNDTDVDEKDATVKMCEICFISFKELKESKIQIVSTPCGHVYCRDCIVGALQIKPECPHCRSVVQIKNLRRLFL